MAPREPIHLPPGHSKLGELDLATAALIRGEASSPDSTAASPGEPVTDVLLAAARRVVVASESRGSAGRQAFLGVVTTATFQQERVIARPDFLPAWFLRIGAERARAVCFIEFERDGQSFVGTGFMVSPTLMLTNHHVFPSPAVARGAKVFFDYEADERGRQINPSVFLTDPDRAFLANERLDFCLVAIAGDPGDRWGTVKLSRAPQSIRVGERVNIVQHPAGRLKEIVVQANEITEVSDLAIKYVADTEGGSSGAPVFDQRWELIALHHLGSNQANVGVRIDVIVKWLDVTAAEGAGGPLLRELLASVPDSGDLGWFDTKGLTPPAGATVPRAPGGSAPRRASLPTRAEASPETLPPERVALEWVGGAEYLDVGHWRLAPSVGEGGQAGTRVAMLAQVIDQAGADLLVVERLTKTEREALSQLLRERSIPALPLGHAALLVHDAALTVHERAIDAAQRDLLETTVRGRAVVPSFVQLELTLARPGSSLERRCSVHVVELDPERDLPTRAHRNELARVLGELARASGGDVLVIGALADVLELPGLAAPRTDLGVLAGPSSSGAAWLGDGAGDSLEQVIVDPRTRAVVHAAGVRVRPSERPLPLSPQLDREGAPLLARLVFGEAGLAAGAGERPDESRAGVVDTVAERGREIAVDGHVRKIVILD